MDIKIITLNHSIKSMDFGKCIYTALITSIILLSGCAVKNIYNRTDTRDNDYITITGIAVETKDGYYINGCVLVYEEIPKSKTDKPPDVYGNKKIKVIGKTKEVNPKCTLYEQCRKGQYKVIYDVQSIKIIE